MACADNMLKAGLEEVQRSLNALKRVGMEQAVPGSILDEHGGHLNVDEWPQDFSPTDWWRSRWKAWLCLWGAAGAEIT